MRERITEVAELQLRLDKCITLRITTVGNLRQFSDSRNRAR